MNNPQLGNLYANQYEMINTVGDGGYATAFRAKDIVDGSTVLIKMIHPYNINNDIAVKAFSDEYYVLLRFKNSSCNKYLVLPKRDMLEHRVGSLIYPLLVFEYLNGENLRIIADRRGGWLFEDEVLEILEYMSDILLIAHSKSIVYTDFKLDHMFYDPNNATHPFKLIDWNRAEIVNPGQEQLFREDIFELGRTLYEALTGVRVFDSRSPLWKKSKDVSMNPEIVKGVRFPVDFGCYKNAISYDIINIIKKMLNSINDNIDNLGNYKSISDLRTDLVKIQRRGSEYIDLVSEIKKGDYKYAWQKINEAIEKDPYNSEAIKMFTLLRIIIKQQKQ